jgi:futalosine hydrolase
MRTLVVSATSMEIGRLTSALGDATSRLPEMATYCHRGHDVDVLITGIGMVATAARTSRALAGRRYDLALNFGVCGSFDPALAPGQVVHVVADRIAELGAEDRDRFLTVQDLQLLGDDEFPFTRGQLINSAPPPGPALSRWPAVSGITVNTAHGNERTIAAIVERFAPQVESMEGAAFMYACLIEHVAFAQVRAVSNVVAPRNRDQWKMEDAVRNLGDAAMDLLDHL